jgi:hypothetical protein
MHHQFSTAERWQLNLPATDEPRLRVPLLVVTLALAMVISLGAATLAHGAGPILQTADRPVTAEVYVFSTPGCSACQMLKSDLRQSGVPGYRVVLFDQGGPEYAEFCATVPQVNAEMPGDRIGVVGKRPVSPVFPMVWIRGTQHYWVGYSSGAFGDLQQYLADNYPGRAPSPVQPALPLTQTVPVASPAAPRNDFDGVHVIVTIANLTAQMPEFRADVARRADRALSELVRQTIGEKASAHIIAEVADPKRFDAVCAAAGMRPGANGIPVACQVLIPERYKGLQALLVRQVEQALDQHFLVPLQSAGVQVIIERIHGETYGAVLDAATGDLDGSPAPLDPENTIPFALAAWLGERSNLARRLLIAAGLMKA